MRFTRAIAVAYLGSVLLGGCSSSVPRAPQTYVVRPQDTLYSIAWRHDLDYRDLATWNHIGSDYRLAVGQVLVMSGVREPAAAPGRPAAQTSSQARTPAAQASPSAPPKTSRAPLKGAQSPSSTQAPPALQTPQAPAAPATAGGTLKWIWPTERVAPLRPVPGGGVLLFGRLGQDVQSASSGRVVYTGNGIRGYGNLIIIKHADGMLSSYAHNRDILVRDGQDVSLGQTIAHMGAGPHQVAVLYFEIRANGKPVDPLAYLPR